MPATHGWLAELSQGNPWAWFTADPTGATILAVFVAAIVLWVLTAVLRGTWFWQAIRSGRHHASDPDLEETLATSSEFGPVSSWRETGNNGRINPHLYGVVDGFGAGWIVFVYLWLASAQISASNAFSTEERTIRVGDLWVSIGFQLVMAGLVMYAMSVRQMPTAWLGLRWPAWRITYILGPLSVLGMWLIFGVLEWVGYAKWIESFGIETVQDTVRVLQTQKDPMLLVVMAFSAIIVAPICEEIIFRGYLYGVAKRFCGRFVGTICTAMIFAAAHANLMVLLPLALFGLLLSWLYERTGSIWAPIAAHACFNAATVVVQLLSR